VTEELADCGFLDDCNKDAHLQLLLCMSSYSKVNLNACSLEKVSRLLAKFTEMLDDDAMIYSELTALMLEVFKHTLKDHSIVESESVAYQTDLANGLHRKPRAAQRLWS
jgi:hypothetical protein